VAADYRRRSDAVIFDCAPKFSDDGKRLHIRARNIRRVRAVRSADTASVLSDVERPTTRFDSVIGGKEAKDVLKSVQEWLVAPKQLTAAGLPLPKGVLLVGRPGTGKTMLARALAGESSCAFLERAATSFVTTWQGSGAQNVRDLFAAARRYAPSVLFIDEIDAMGRDRARVNGGGAGFGEAMALNQLLVEMDGFSQPGNRPVIVIAATNHAEVLDLALLRRFSRVVEVEPPTRDERIQFLWNRVTARADHKVKREVIEQIGANSAGFTVADLERILGEAARAAYKAKRPLDDAILEDAFGKIVYGPEKQGADLERTARHEAGHAVVMCLLGNPPTYATIVGRGNFGGYVAREVEEGSRSHSKQELKDLICQCLGGLEAECLYYGPDGGPSTGPASDLEQASKIAESMVLDLGMSDELGTVRIDRRQLVGVLAELGHAAVRKIIDEQRTRVAQLIREHRSALERVSLALFQKQRLLQREILDLMNPRPES
jgi:ATP-dependent metalloprotease FtsH